VYLRIADGEASAVLEITVDVICCEDCREIVKDHLAGAEICPIETFRKNISGQDRLVVINLNTPRSAAQRPRDVVAIVVGKRVLFIRVVVVTRKNITDDSGVSQYVMDDNGKKSEELIFNSVIKPGELIYWNDKRVWHYGTELKVADANVNGGRGIRDIIILSAKTPPANMPMGPVPERFKTWIR